MSKLETLIDEEQQRSDAWKEQKTAERNELNALSDEAVTKTTTEPEAYLRYLDVQAEFDACYDPAAKTIFVSPGLSEAKQFAALAREVYHASAHENSRAGEYDREQYALDAESAGYMLCRSFGVPCEKPDAAKVVELYADMEPMERRCACSSTGGCAGGLHRNRRRGDGGLRLPRRRAHRHRTGAAGNA